MLLHIWLNELQVATDTQLQWERTLKFKTKKEWKGKCDEPKKNQNFQHLKKKKEMIETKRLIYMLNCKKNIS